MSILVSVIIRTLNEERYLPELLSSINTQNQKDFDVEVILVDSGSEDGTLSIAKSHGCRITYISKDQFSFGSSLNLGCEFALGEILVFVSGHCVPVDQTWLEKLIGPLRQGTCDYTYGRQVGRDTTKFSENQLFEKYFPCESRVPQVGFFCNNANAAIKTEVWRAFSFDEYLTGCEDMELAKRISLHGGRIGYVSDSTVFHIHDESWAQVSRRYEREAVALSKIMPSVFLTKWDAIKFFWIAIVKDLKVAVTRGVLRREFFSIICFRWCQYWGGFKGSKLNKELSHELKIKYFYPRLTNLDIED